MNPFFTKNNLFVKSTRLAIAAVALCLLLLPAATQAQQCSSASAMTGQASSYSGGLCLAWWNNTDAAADNSLYTAAGYDNFSLGIGCYAAIEASTSTTYPAGTTMGIVVDNGGNTLFGNILGSLLSNATLELTNNGQVVQTLVSGGGLLDVSTFLLTGLSLNNYQGAIGGVARVPFNGWRFTYSFAFGALNGIRVYGGAVKGGCFSFANCAGTTINPTGSTAFVASGTGGQQGQLSIPVTVSSAGPVYISVSGGGFRTTQQPFLVNLTSGQTTINIPVVYDGSGAAGTRTVTVTASTFSGQSLSNGSCNVNVNVNANVVNPPTVTYTPNPIVSGVSTTFTATGCSGTISWLVNGTVVGTGSPFTYTPSAGTSITSICTVNGTASAPTTAIVVPVPAPTISTNTSPIYAGQTVTLTANGCSGTVTWLNNGVIVGSGTPFTTTAVAGGNYTATCTINGVVSPNSSGISVSTAPPTPTTPPVISSATSPIIVGAQVVLNATGCTNGTITWYKNGNSTGSGSSIATTFQVNDVYTATCTLNGIMSLPSNTLTATTTVPAPVVTSSPNPPVAGQQVTLTATGCTGTITWFNNGTQIGTGTPITLTASAGANYTATCTVSSTASSPSNGISVPAQPLQDLAVTINSTSFGQYLPNATRTYTITFTNTLSTAGTSSVSGLITAPFGWSCTGCGAVTIPVLGANGTYVVNVSLTANNAGASGNLTANISNTSGSASIDSRSDNNSAVVILRTSN